MTECSMNSMPSYSRVSVFLCRSIMSKGNSERGRMKLKIYQHAIIAGVTCRTERWNLDEADVLR